MAIVRDLPISKKFGFAFGAVCLLTALLGTAALVGFLKVNTNVGDIVENAMPSTKVLGDIRYSISTIRRTDALLLLCKTDECTNRLVPKRKSYLASYNKAIEVYAQMVSYPGEKELYEAVAKNAATYIDLSNRSRALADAGRVLVRSGGVAEADSLGSLFELLEERMVAH